jgi:hypothetical protein
LAVVLKTDPVELLRVAGREIGSRSFEQRVLTELQTIRSGIDRLESGIRDK